MGKEVTGKAPNESLPPEVVFLVFHESALDHFFSMASIFQRRGQPFSFLVPTKGPLMSDPDAVLRAAMAWGLTNPRIEKYRPHWLGRGRLRRRLAGVVPILQSPYISDHASRALGWAVKVLNLWYVPYAPHLEKDTSMAFDLPVFRGLARILVPSQLDVDKFLSRGLNEQILALCQHPVLEELRYRKRAQDHPQTPSTILWAPHWWTRWSNFNQGIFPLLAFAKENPDWKVRIRAHPFLTHITKKKLPASYGLVGALSRKEEEGLAQLLGLPSVEVSTRPLVTDMMESSAMIGDGASLPIYFAEMGRPQALIRRADSPTYRSDIWLVLRSAVRVLPANPDAIKDWLDSVAKHREEVNVEAMKKVSETVSSSVLPSISDMIQR